mmetsp:Transcript_8030/g.49604  ORF Transcript_8030/g.49604 Transcript_8030/m.49604 type:complete len:312 (-) Transcript_8030:953-1888(-)
MPWNVWGRIRRRPSRDCTHAKRVRGTLRKYSRFDGDGAMCGRTINLLCAFIACYPRNTPLPNESQPAKSFSSILQSNQVSFPACVAILLSSFLRSLGLDHSTTDNDHVAASFTDHRLGSVVLLAKIVSTLLQLHARGHVNQTRGTRSALPRRWRDRDEANHKIFVCFGCSSDCFCVLSLAKSALRAHLCQQQEPATLRGTAPFQPIDDTRAWYKMSVGDMGPVGDLVDTTFVLHADCIADVSKLPILKNHEVMLLGQLLDLRAEFRREVRQDIHMGLKHANRGANLVCQLQQFVGSADICSNTQVRLLASH